MIRPTYLEIEEELKRINYKEKYRNTIIHTIYTLITVSALSVLIATLFLPVLQIYGKSMEPTLIQNDIVVSLKRSEIKQGDIVSFYYNNKILVKRAIAFSGDWVDMDKEGNVYVNGRLLDEPYIKEKHLGDTNIVFPYQVPENRLFVIGDDRATSIDSRNKSVGCVSDEQIVGVIKFRIWPIDNIGPIE